jgi:hypothetical protein
MRSAPASVAHEPMYRLNTEPMKTRIPGRMPIAHITRACASAIRRQSARPMPNAVGRPVVPEVPCTRVISPGGTHK